MVVEELTARGLVPVFRLGVPLRCMLITKIKLLIKKIWDSVYVL